MKLLLVMIVVSWSFSSMASVNLDACREKLAIDTAELIGVIREEQGRPVPPLTCDVDIFNVRDGEKDSPCEKMFDFKATCTYSGSNAEVIEDEGGACCPG